jgi:hypothetical protein
VEKTKPTNKPSIFKDHQSFSCSFHHKNVVKKKLHKTISYLEFEFVPSTTYMHLCPIRDPPTITLAHKTIFFKK